MPNEFEVNIEKKRAEAAHITIKSFNSEPTDKSMKIIHSLAQECHNMNRKGIESKQTTQVSNNDPKHNKKESRFQREAERVVTAILKRPKKDADKDKEADAAISQAITYPIYGPPIKNLKFIDTQYILNKNSNLSKLARSPQILSEKLSKDLHRIKEYTNHGFNSLYRNLELFRNENFEVVGSLIQQTNYLMAYFHHYYYIADINPQFQQSAFLKEEIENKYNNSIKRFKRLQQIIEEASATDKKKAEDISSNLDSLREEFESFRKDNFELTELLNRQNNSLTALFGDFSRYNYDLNAQLLHSALLKTEYENNSKGSIKNSNIMKKTLEEGNVSEHKENESTSNEVQVINEKPKRRNSI